MQLIDYYVMYNIKDRMVYHYGDEFILLYNQANLSVFF